MKSPNLPNRTGSGVYALRACGRAAVTATLCGLMVAQTVLGEALRPAPVVRVTELQGQERVLHALNRLTFGPRPGEVQAVEAIGLNKWFEQQLNPGAIDDSALEARLAEYPAMNLPLNVLERKYPSPQMLKAIMEGKVPLPTDPTARAMVADQIEFYKIQVNGRKAGDAPAAPASDGQAMAGDMSSAPAAASAKKPKQSQVNAGMNALDAARPEADKPVAASELSTDPMMAAGPAAGTAKISREQAEALVSLPPDQRMAKMMTMSPNQLVRLRAVLGNGPEQARLTEGLSPEQKEILIALPGGIRMIALEAMESRLMRDIYSNRQLEAVMTDFWLNHFNVYVRKNQNEPYMLPAYERETIRPHALGSFEDLLVATAQSPAMLIYLDNYRSDGPDSPAAARIRQAQKNYPDAKQLKQVSAGLNENYGRELMELHTLGVNGGYTQADVTMVAKVFTGWGLDKPYQGGGYQFDERRHEPGPKVVLGKTISENGEKEGLEVLHMLATSPATAHFISTKLAVRFVSDTPPPALVDRMAASFLKSNGDIKTVLRTMFQSPEFWAASTDRAKVKTPEEFVISAVRASGANVVNPQALVQSLDKLGMPLYGMQTPNGYSWKQDEWVSTGALVSRMNFALILSANRLPGVRMDWTDLLGEKQAGVVPASYDVPAAGTTAAPATAAKEKKLESVLLGAPVSEKTRATVIGQSNDQNVTDQAETQFDLNNGGQKQRKDYIPKGMRNNMGPNAGPDDAQAAVMAGLLLGSPEFQRR